MTDVQVHAGDLAEYTGTVKALAGARCVVDQDLLARVRVVFKIGASTIVRNVKRKNLKRLGGGVIADA
jgi:hypothetical protein